LFRQLFRQLGEALPGDPWGQTPARQVGYLRRVPDGQATSDAVEVVLRRPVGRVAGVGQGAEAGQGAQGSGVLRWMPAPGAFALLPVDLAPVALNEFHRLQPPRGE
jgi:hypothetical protein